ncbi:MAG: hypothetical protein M0Q42_11400 [Xanthomonadales bacterium]|nr:hypothetical protein [Xanthomonadales bacterium]
MAFLLLEAGTAVALDPQPPELVSVRWDTGEPSFGVCAVPRFARNSRFLAFGCLADQLVPGDSNNQTDSFLLDRQTGTIERVSVSSQGQQMHYPSAGGFASTDGDRVAFVGLGPLHPDYGPPPPNDLGPSAAYLRHRSSGQTDLISRAANGQALFGSVALWDARPDRNEILFTFHGDPRISEYQDLFGVAGQLWIRDWVTGEYELISRTPDGALSNGGGGLASFSETGQYVVFTSRADDLGPPAQLGDTNVYWHDRLTGQTERLTYPWQGGEFQQNHSVSPTPPRVSRDGRFVAFTTTSAEIHPDVAVPSGTHVYLIDRQTGQLDHLSATPHPSYNTSVGMSADARYVAWATRNFSFLGPPDPPADMRGVWVLDRHTGQRVNVAAPLGPLYLDNEVSVGMAPDGSAVAFTWRIADPDRPILSNTQLYTAQLRGPTPPVPAPVPAVSAWLLALLGVFIVLLGTIRLPNQRTCVR